MLFKIYNELGQEPLSKVVELYLSWNFAFGRFWTYMEEFGEKCERKQPNINFTEFSGISEKSPKVQKPIVQNLRGFWQKSKHQIEFKFGWNRLFSETAWQPIFKPLFLLDLAIIRENSLYRNWSPIIPLHFSCLQKIEYSSFFRSYSSSKPDG